MNTNTITVSGLTSLEVSFAQAYPETLAVQAASAEQGTVTFGVSDGTELLGWLQELADEAALEARMAGITGETPAMTAARSLRTAVRAHLGDWDVA